MMLQYGTLCKTLQEVPILYGTFTFVVAAMSMGHG